MSAVTRASILVALELMQASYEAIKAMGSQGLPSGHLYARLMAHLDLDGYTKMIRLMESKGLIFTKNDVLYVAVN